MTGFASRSEFVRQTLRAGGGLALGIGPLVAAWRVSAIRPLAELG